MVIFLVSEVVYGLYQNDPIYLFVCLLYSQLKDFALITKTSSNSLRKLFSNSQYRSYVREKYPKIPPVLIQFIIIESWLVVKKVTRFSMTLVRVQVKVKILEANFLSRQMFSSFEWMAQYNFLACLLHCSSSSEFSKSSDILHLK